MSKQLYTLAALGFNISRGNALFSTTLPSTVTITSWARFRHSMGCNAPLAVTLHGVR